MMNKPMSAVLALIVGFWVGGNAQPQDGDAAAQIAALQKQVKQHQMTLASQDAALKELGRRLDAAETWFRGVPGTAVALEAAVQSAEANGFTNAGANPRAREILLSGLRTLATGLKTGLPSGAPTAK